MNSIDNGYKLMFSQPDMIRDLLLGFVHQDWVKDVDFATLAPVPTERITEKLTRRFNDIVWKVGLKDQELYVCIMLEFQSTPDKWMSLRILTYLGLLYQHLQDSGQLLPGGLLPPVLPIVMYNGKPKWNCARDIHELVAHYSGDLAVYSPRLPFLLIDESDYSKEVLCSPQMKESKNLVSALFRLENADSDYTMYEVITELLSWLELPRQQSLSRALAAWYNRVFRDSNEQRQNAPLLEDLTEVKSMLHETVQEWRREAERKGREKGREEGRAAGREEGREERREELIFSMHKNGIPVEQIAIITAGTENEIQLILEKRSKL